jgi:hypothetical protein
MASPLRGECLDEILGRADLHALNLPCCCCLSEPTVRHLPNRTAPKTTLAIEEKQNVKPNNSGNTNAQRQAVGTLVLGSLNFNLDGKFENLKKYSKGRKAISEVLEKYTNCTKLVIHNKKFSVACRFFEYVFEPVLASKNSIFYSIEFHKFISNLIYLHLQVEPQSAEDLLDNFEKMMRSKSPETRDEIPNATTSSNEAK